MVASHTGKIDKNPFSTIMLICKNKQAYDSHVSIARHSVRQLPKTSSIQCRSSLYQEKMDWVGVEPTTLAQ
jgi:hypothetical protein